jgi:hypothetical protein
MTGRDALLSSASATVNSSFLSTKESGSAKQKEELSTAEKWHNCGETASFEESSCSIVGVLEGTLFLQTKERIIA